MKSQDKPGRRQFLIATGGLTAIAVAGLEFTSPGAVHAAPPEDGAMQRINLDLGHRATRSGPVAALSDGSLLWVTTEPEAPYLSKSMWAISRLAMRRSSDGGKSWSDAQLLAQGTAEYSLLSHALLQLASGVLVHIYSRYSGYDYETGTPAKSLNQIYVQHSADGGRTWGEPKNLNTGERYQGDTLSMEQLRDGRVIYPFCFLTNVKSQFAVSVMFSDDDGKTWNRSESILRTGGGGFESGASEPTVVELSDGRLWMLIRSQTGFLWESFSRDRGKTWSPGVESRLPSSNAPATACRLRSGEIAVAWNDHVESNYARQSIVVGLTKDGRNFSAVREFDFTDFTDDPTASIPHVTYAYLTESKEGKVIISYNKGNWSRHNRPSLARISPAWIGTKLETVDLHDGRTGWHTIDPGKGVAAASERYIREGEAIWLEIEQHPTNKAPTGIVRNIPLVADGEIEIAVQVNKPEAFLLFSDNLLSPRNVDEAAIRVRFADGKAFISSGTGERSQNDRRSTQYSFLSRRIRTETEIAYPASFALDRELKVSLRFQADKRLAELSINGGPKTEIKTDSMLGLTFVGFLVANGGRLRFRTMKTTLK
ncbi:MAG TPA: sialidase family protein [Pyrinomonadaceae bacterium]|nr:sialidase family protein [Pyrinomonadaceae bacterium]